MSLILSKELKKLAEELRKTSSEKTEAKKMALKKGRVELDKGKPDHDHLILHDMQNHLNDFERTENYGRKVFKS